MRLYLDKRCQYGTIRYFPVGVGSTEVMALTGKKTLTPKEIYCLEQLGHEIFIESVEGTELPSAFQIHGEEL